MKNKFEYDLALSFAGEDREYVEQVAKCLKANNIKFFYDDYNEAYLWGKDLFQHLDDLYKNKAKYCVIFTSKTYASKIWTNHELKSAQERALEEKDKVYILPAKFDDTPIPGIRTTTSYVDLRKKTPEQFCKLILEKLNLESHVIVDKKAQRIEYDITIPKVRKQFTDLDKKQMVSNAYDHLTGYFKTGLKKMEDEYDFIKTEYEEITNTKFIARIYRYGKLESSCKVWLGTGFTNNNSISYLEGRSEIDTHNDNSYNDNLYIENNGNEMFFRASMAMGNAPLNLNPHKLLIDGVAKYLWGRFTKYLEY